MKSTSGPDVCHDLKRDADCEHTKLIPDSSGNQVPAGVCSVSFPRVALGTPLWAMESLLNYSCRENKLYSNADGQESVNVMT